MASYVTTVSEYGKDKEEVSNRRTYAASKTTKRTVRTRGL